MLHLWIQTSNFLRLAYLSTFSYRSYVRIVYSTHPGNGKSLYVYRMGEALVQAASPSVQEPILSIPIHGPDICNDVVLEKLCRLKSTDSKIIHFDIATSV